MSYPSEKEKNAAIGVLKYEIGRFRKAFTICGPTAVSRTASSVTYLEEQTGEPVDEKLIDIAIESFLLHTRNLLHFFTAGAVDRVKDDVLAIDYINNWSPPKMLYLDNEETRTNLNKFLSHITYTRVNTQKPRWDFPRINSEIEEAYRAFRKTLPKPDRSKWL